LEVLGNLQEGVVQIYTILREDANVVVTRSTMARALDIRYPQSIIAISDAELFHGLRTHFSEFAM
jgi:hypothetical protein